MKLVPPNTTPDWTPSQDRVGLKRIEYHDHRGEWWQLQNWYVQDDAQHEANCKFFLAAPAMAAALVRALDALETFQREFNMTSGGLADECRSALLSAGYTQSDSES
jgi:hypothetical protein